MIFLHELRVAFQQLQELLLLLCLRLGGLLGKGVVHYLKLFLMRFKIFKLYNLMEPNPSSSIDDDDDFGDWNEAVPEQT